MTSTCLPRFMGMLCAVVLAFFITGASAQYCNPTYYIGCGSGCEINDFKLTGEASTAISDLATGCSSASTPSPFATQCYRDMHTSMSVTLYQGGTYTVKANDGAPVAFSATNFQVWIDFDDNNSFSSSESVAGGALPLLTGALTNFTLTIPAGATLGTHRMRAAVSGEETYPALSPCPAGGFPPVNQQGEVHDYSVLIATASTTTCPPVTGLTMSGITSASAILNWTAAAGAIGYEWAVDMSPTAPASGTATTLTTATASGLTAATGYYAHVRTKCSATSFSTWVNVAFTTSTTSTTCSPVTGVTMSGITAASAVLNWTAVTGAIGYEWAATTSATPPASGTATTLLTATATGLTAATAYYAHVRAQCSATLFSAWVSNPFTTTTSTTTSCAPVTLLSASAITTTSATISWTGVSGSVGYVYVVDNTVSAPTSPAGTFTTLTTAAISGLTAGTTYYAHVRDSCAAGSVSSWVTIPISTLTVGGCNAVTSLTATGVTANSATVNWVRATGAIGVEYVLDNTAASPSGAGTGTTALNHTFTGLTAATTYYAHVRDSCSATSLSAWVTIPLTTAGSTGITGTYAPAFSITAYPNPVNDVLTVAIDGGIAGTAHIQLVDITGKLLRSIITTTNNSLQFDMSGLPSGIYCVRYIDADHTQTIKISK